MSWTSTILLWAAFFLLCAGIVGLLRPATLRLKSRWQALPVALGCIAAIGLAQILMPDPLGSPIIETQLRGLSKVVFWAVACWFCLSKAKRSAPVEAATDTQKPDRTPEEVDAIRRDLRRARLDPQAVQDLPPSSRPSLKSAGESLSLQFDRYKAGQVSLEEYQAFIVEEADALQAQRENLRGERSSWDPDDYADELTRIDEEGEEIAWRQDWVRKRIKDQSLREIRPEVADRGKWARFEYVDNDGVVTKREVVNWEVSGRYVRGYCKMRKEERSFRIDRISEWVSR
ncbi:hypothetical protein [Novosphingobium clariflavum]|uniref:Uncharacterized protein n=1 Tax=Novosphingobium clariflavum TaxID=2029884 RepID=A0ABV6S2W7_9SPHN|nr:hypothetical protein [Novosphingobium clariflavum]